MPAPGESIERLELTFRAEPAPASRSSLPGGWTVWCLIGIGIGIATWLIGREQLVRTLRKQLTDASSVGEALIAVDGLSKLSPDASLDMVTVLEHPDPLIAKTAYQRLDLLLTHWQTVEESTAHERYQQLAMRLANFSSRAPLANQMLASDLASRLRGLCIASNNPQLKPTIDICIAVIERATSGRTANGQPSFEQWSLSYDPEKSSASERNTLQVAAQPLPDAGSLPGDAVNSPQPIPQNVYRDSDVLRDNAAEQPLELPPGEQDVIASDATQTYNAAPANIVSTNIPSRAPVRLQPTASIQLRVGPTQPRRPLYPSQPGTLVSNQGSHSSLNESYTSDTDYESLTFEQLVRMLSSIEPGVAQAAALALKAKGMDDELLSLASELAVGSEERRLELVKQIASNGTFEPRPWLLWMAEDGEPQVRQMSVSLLSSMLDNDVQRHLQILLASEEEPSVAQALRQALQVDRRQAQVLR